MDVRPQDQLDKVLALADSDHDGEAIGALRKARQMLMRQGLNFSDLARAAIAQRPRFGRTLSIFNTNAPQMELQVQQLRQRVDDLKAELQTQTIQTEFWRRRATELEHNLTQSAEQSTRWRQLARETVEKLWDLGQAINVEEFDAAKSVKPVAPERKSA